MSMAALASATTSVPQRESRRLRSMGQDEEQNGSSGETYWTAPKSQLDTALLTELTKLESQIHDNLLQSADGFRVLESAFTRARLDLMAYLQTQARRALLPYIAARDVMKQLQKMTESPWQLTLQDVDEQLGGRVFLSTRFFNLLRLFCTQAAPVEHDKSSDVESDSQQDRGTCSEDDNDRGMDIAIVQRPLISKMEALRRIRHEAYDRLSKGQKRTLKHRIRMCTPDDVSRAALHFGITIKTAPTKNRVLIQPPKSLPVISQVEQSPPPASTRNITSPKSVKTPQPKQSLSPRAGVATPRPALEAVSSPARSTPPPSPITLLKSSPLELSPSRLGSITIRQSRSKAQREQRSSSRKDERDTDEVIATTPPLPNTERAIPLAARAGKQHISILSPVLERTEISSLVHLSTTEQSEQDDTLILDTKNDHAIESYATGQNGSGVHDNRKYHDDTSGEFVDGTVVPDVDGHTGSGILNDNNDTTQPSIEMGRGLTTPPMDVMSELSLSEWDGNCDEIYTQHTPPPDPTDASILDPDSSSHDLLGTHPDDLTEANIHLDGFTRHDIDGADSFSEAEAEVSLHPESAPHRSAARGRRPDGADSRGMKRRALCLFSSPSPKKKRRFPKPSLAADLSGATTAERAASLTRLDLTIQRPMTHACTSGPSSQKLTHLSEDAEPLIDTTLDGVAMQDSDKTTLHAFLLHSAKTAKTPTTSTQRLVDRDEQKQQHISDRHPTNDYAAQHLTQRKDTQLLVQLASAAHPVSATTKDAAMSADKNGQRPDGLSRFSSRQWLSDDCINTVLQPLCTDDHQLFYICDADEVVDWESWCKSRRSRRRLMPHSKVLVPFVLKKHWVLLLLDFSDRRVHLFNSMRSYDIGNVLPIVRAVLRVFEVSEKETDEWTFEDRPDACQQQNGNDCGVFLLLHALYIISGLPLPSSFNMPMWRGLFLALIHREATMFRIADVDIDQKAFQHATAVLSTLFAQSCRKKSAARASLERLQHDVEVRRCAMNQYLTAVEAVGGAAVAVTQAMSVSLLHLEAEVSLLQTRLPLIETECQTTGAWWDVVCHIVDSTPIDERERPTLFRLGGGVCASK